jgi:hypothetical protein
MPRKPPSLSPMLPARGANRGMAFSPSIGVTPNQTSTFSNEYEKPRPFVPGYIDVWETTLLSSTVGVALAQLKRVTTRPEVPLDCTVF